MYVWSNVQVCVGVSCSQIVFKWKVVQFFGVFGDFLSESDWVSECVCFCFVSFCVFLCGCMSVCYFAFSLSCETSNSKLNSSRGLNLFR